MLALVKLVYVTHDASLILPTKIHITCGYYDL